MEGLKPPRQWDGRSPEPGLVDVHDRPMEPNPSTNNGTVSVGSPSGNELGQAGRSRWPNGEGLSIV